MTYSGLLRSTLATNKLSVAPYCPQSIQTSHGPGVNTTKHHQLSPKLAQDMLQHGNANAQNDSTCIPSNAASMLPHVKLFLHDEGKVG